MVAVVVVMVLILLVAGVVAVYVAYPHRGEDVPAVPWVGDAMAKAADAMPVLDDDDEVEFRLQGAEESQHLR
ncbi:hypothetical protein GON03_04060 [Nocardioides sp. MAH-18]|uniref:Uncharacterized protein n=1 Tax=Nocardioides agri TaxID=2682843 RepID=A0A6L6XNQ2_9ACTN|nr:MULTISPECIES: hypothetical protein [unclassified Nocardioides]MBA2953476.1 hypothetical protein [Nocardioides sp. CGMCC 1.13656]MVQ48343.1 hypothetical protein [Nocardioides sp. MAH-18]